MRKRDKLVKLWASSRADPLVAVTNAVRFGLEEPLLEATPGEREELAGWHSGLAARAARAVVGEYANLPASASQFVREDALVRIATHTAVEILGGLGLVLLWEWITQRDARVCKRCGPLDGKIMRPNTLVRLPLHPNCRCGLRPVVQ